MKLSRIGLLLIVALAMCAVSAQAQDPKAPDPSTMWDGKFKRAEIAAMFTEYLAAAEARKKEIRQALDGLGIATAKDVKDLAKELGAKLKTAGDKIESTSSSTFSFGGLSGTIYVSGNQSASPLPLMIALHGGGRGSGDGKSAQGIASPFSKAGVIISPTAPELRDIAWNFEDIEAWVLGIIEAAKRTWDIDTNRIYVSGHSMGGFGTWSIGCRHADRFAALGPGAAGGRDERAREHLPNLLNTPIYFYHSTDDSVIPADTDRAAAKTLEDLKAKGYPYDFVYKEYTNRGHGTPPGGCTDQINWMLERKRNAYPKWVVWQPSRPNKKLFNWIEASNTGSTLKYAVVDKDMFVGTTGRIEAKIVGNAIAVTTSGTVGNLTLHLNDSLVNFLAPVVIRLNDKEVFNGKIYPRLGALIHTLATTRDLNQYYFASIELSAPSPNPAGQQNPGPEVKPPPTDSEIKAKLKEKSEAMSFDKSPFGDVMQVFSLRTGLAVNMDENSAKMIGLTAEITVSLPAGTVGEQLEALCKAKGATFEVRGGAVWLFPGPNAGQPQPAAPVDKYPKGTAGFKVFMDMVAMILPAGHYALRATSVTDAVSRLTVGDLKKLRQIALRKLETAQGEEKALLREFRDMLPE